MHRWQTFLRNEAKQETRKSIMPGVCDHAWAQTFCDVSEDSEHRPEDRDEHHAASTFVTVTGAENNRRGDKSDISIAAEDRKLTLEIAAEDKLFHKTGGTTQRNPDHEAESGLRTQHLGEPLGICHLRSFGKS